MTNAVLQAGRPVWLSSTNGYLPQKSLQPVHTTAQAPEAPGALSCRTPKALRETIQALPWLFPHNMTASSVDILQPPGYAKALAWL